MAKVTVSKKEKEQKQKALKVQKKVESSDDESSEEESSEEEVAKKVTASTSGSSSSDSSSSDSSSAESSSESESSESEAESEAESESSSESEEEKAPKKAAKKDSDESDDDESDESESSESESSEEEKEEEEEEEEAPKKKIKTETGAKPAAAPAKPAADGEGCSVFVGRLAWATTDDSLKAHFKKCGKIASARVATDRESGRSRGFGHIDFETAEAAQAALEFEGSELDGRQIHVELSQGRPQNNARAGGRFGGDGQSDEGTTVFIKGFDTNQSEEDVRAALQEAFGACGDVTRISLPTDRDSGYLKGIAFIDFATKEGKTKAGDLSGTEVAGGNIFVDLNSKPKGPPGGDGGRGGRGGGRGGRDFGRGGRGGRDGGRGGRGGRGGFGRGGRGGQRIDVGAGTGKKMSFDD